MSAARKATKTTTKTAPKLAPEAEAEGLLKRLNILSDQKDALESIIKADKARLRALMEEQGDRITESDYYGSAVFAPRRNFQVLDADLLAKRCTKAFLAEGFKATAALVDALAERGVSIDKMISIGVNEQFTYRRPATAEADARRRSIIEDSKDRMQAKVNEIVATL